MRSIITSTSKQPQDLADSNSLGLNEIGKQGQNEPIPDELGERSQAQRNQQQFKLRLSGRGTLANPNSQRQQNREGGGKTNEQSGNGTAGNCSGGSGTENRWPPEPRVGRVVDGVAHGVDRLKALGNGQVPAVAKMAWQLIGGMNKQ